MEQIKRLYDDEESAQRERELNNARRRAVLQAWQRERTYVNDGKGTRDWTKEQQKEILSHGSVCGYEGHHMRSPGAVYRCFRAGHHSRSAASRIFR